MGTSNQHCICINILVLWKTFLFTFSCLCHIRRNDIAMVIYKPRVNFQFKFIYKPVTLLPRANFWQDLDVNIHTLDSTIVTWPAQMVCWAIIYYFCTTHFFIFGQQFLNGYFSPFQSFTLEYWKMSPGHFSLLMPPAKS